MKKQIKFIYALLIIVIIGGGVSLVLQDRINPSGNIVSSFQNTNNQNKLNTVKYAGIYRYGYEKEGGAGGSIIIYPETDKVILFDLQLSKGAPSYNSGELSERLVVNNEGKGELILKNDDFNCQLSFTFTSTGVIISEDISNSNQNCGFGNGVKASGVYEKIKSDIPESFTDLEGRVFYFKNYEPDTIFDELAQIDNLKNNIDSLIMKGILVEKKKEYKYENPGAALEVIYIDKSEKISKYIIKTGSDDSALKYEFYYDNDKNFRFVLITSGAVNGSGLKHEIYFNTQREKISELQTVTGPGYAWSKMWPLDDIVFEMYEFNKYNDILLFGKNCNTKGDIEMYKKKLFPFNFIDFKLEELKKYFNSNVKISVEKNIDDNNPFSIYSFSDKNSIVSFFVKPDDKYYYLNGFSISSDLLSLNNNIEVGMSKKEFFKAIDFPACDEDIFSILDIEDQSEELFIIFKDDKLFKIFYRSL